MYGQTPHECLTYVRLTKKCHCWLFFKFLYFFLGSDFQWFCGVLWM